MEKMLEFKPDKRITIEEALADPFFDDIRLEEMEITAEVPADFEFDSNYDMNVSEMKELFIKLINE